MSYFKEKETGNIVDIVNVGKNLYEIDGVIHSLTIDQLKKRFTPFVKKSADCDRRRGRIMEKDKISADGKKQLAKDFRSHREKIDNSGTVDITFTKEALDLLILWLEEEEG